ncbi:MAG: hypothetical protein HQL07_18715 [Nitrospirae bacterium]|nr:hypothetical protein [Magnetococcales bacterium]
MKLDRTMQLEILRQCRNVYPDVIYLDQNQQNNDRNHLGNTTYLYQHGLITGTTHNGDGGLLHFFDWIAITEKGLDFLEDDGGLSAILKTVTIKLDPGDLRTLLSSKVEKANLPGDQKKQLLNVIKSLPVEALKKITQDLLHQAVEHLPDAYRIIEKGVHLLS